MHLIFVTELPGDMVPTVVVNRGPRAIRADAIYIVMGRSCIRSNVSSVRDEPPVDDEDIIDGNKTEIPSATNARGHLDSLIRSLRHSF